MCFYEKSQKNEILPHFVMFERAAIFVLLFSSCLAWLSPERCRLDVQNDESILEKNSSETSIQVDNNFEEMQIDESYKEHKYSILDATTNVDEERRVKRSTVNAETKKNISEEEERIKNELIELYRDYKHSKNPVKAKHIGVRKIELNGPIECALNTAGEILTSYICQANVSCSITHTVSTIDTYTSIESYNWGVKATSKLISIDKLLEIGGELSVGGSYSCSFTKSKTNIETVKCDKPVSEEGMLIMYNIKTQMYCSVGTSIIEDEVRQGQEYHIWKNLSLNEYNTISKNLIRVNGCAFTYMLDTDNVPPILLEKMKREAPLFNPNTDPISVNGLPKPQIATEYYKITSTNIEYTSKIPFTNENGNMHYTYLCTFTPSKNSIPNH